MEDWVLHLSCGFGCCMLHPRSTGANPPDQAQTERDLHLGLQRCHLRCCG
uniref:Uncharacterized protein n=1 Tax=Arundo donax TaxID=35708 RepID=A0A0A9D4T4_ARUDO